MKCQFLARKLKQSMNWIYDQIKELTGDRCTPTDLVCYFKNDSGKNLYLLWCGSIRMARKGGIGTLGIGGTLDGNLAVFFLVTNESIATPQYNSIDQFQYK